MLFYCGVNLLNFSYLCLFSFFFTLFIFNTLNEYLYISSCAKLNIIRLKYFYIKFIILSTKINIISLKSFGILNKLK